MRMLRCISGNARKHTIKNEEIRLMIEVTLVEKVMNRCLRWFDYVQRSPIYALVWKYDLSQGNEKG